MRSRNRSNLIFVRQPVLEWTFACLLTLGGVAAAQTNAVPFSSPRWKFEATGATAVEYLGRPALRLERGIAWLPDAAFSDGVIEFDIAVPRQRGFCRCACA